LRDQAQPEVLDLIGVLILVHHHVLEALAVLLQHLAMLAQHVDHVQQQVAEIARVQRLQPVLVELVELLPLAVGIGLVLARIEIGGVEAAVLPAIDAAGELARGPALLIEPLGLDQLLEHAQLIVGVDDRVVRLQPYQFGVPA
jgi:hypothetical protein